MRAAQVHPQLTLRVKSRAEALPGTPRTARFTTLVCLACDIPVYRLHQIISTEVEGKDVPLLPNDDWAEREIMKSLNGWIDVHKDCLVSQSAFLRASDCATYINGWYLCRHERSRRRPLLYAAQSRHENSDNGFYSLM